MELIKSVDSFMEKPMPISPPRHHRGYHPSAASCIIKNEYDEDETIGKCQRANFWSHKSVEKTNPMNARGIRICTVGKQVESWEVLKYKEMGIWRGNNVKFYDTDNLISGEVDAFVEDVQTKNLIGVEIKTGYGYMFQSQVIGRPDRKGKPKLDHLMQVMLYMNFFKDVPLFKLVYIDRGNAARAEFNITIDKNTGGVKIDGQRYCERLTIPAILHRYEELGKCLEDDALPERDYELQYSKEKLQFLYDSSRLSKTDCKTFDRNGHVEKGDWRCSYCDYKDYCWKEA
jgi:hypothetical protein